jgi:hypothetical protein
VDFQRLFEDRNRCAHPSMISSDDAFQPTAELARTHIVVVISSLLQKPPVQGRVALDRIWTDIDSEYFPADSEKAGEFLRNGPLQRARPSLIRSVVVCLMKDMFQEGRANSKRLRQYAALLAILKVYREPAVAAIKEKLPTLAAAVEDEQFNKVVRFLGTVPGAWEWAGDAARIRAQVYVGNGPAEKLPRYIPYALRSTHLRNFAITRLENLDSEQMLHKLIKGGADVTYADRAIQLLEKSPAFRTAEERMQRLIIPLAPILLAEHIEKICELFETKNQIKWAAGSADLMLDLLRRTSHLGLAARDGWEKVFNVLSTHDYYLDDSRGEELRLTLDEKFAFSGKIIGNSEPEEML